MFYNRRMKIIELTLLLLLLRSYSQASPKAIEPAPYTIKLINSASFQSTTKLIDVKPYLKLAASLLNIELKITDDLKANFDSLLFVTLKNHPKVFTDKTTIFNHGQDFSANSFKFQDPYKTLTVTRLFLDSYSQINQNPSQKNHLIYTLLRELGFLAELRRTSVTNPAEPQLSYKDWLILRVHALQGILNSLYSDQVRQASLLSATEIKEIINISRTQLGWHQAQLGKELEDPFYKLYLNPQIGQCNSILEAQNDTHF